MGTDNALVPAVPPGDLDGRLRGAVEIEQAGAGEGLQHGRLQFGGQGLAAADDALQPLAGGGRRVRHEGLQHGRHEVDGADLVARYQLGQAPGIAVVAGGGQRQACAGGQRPEELPEGDVEAEGVFCSTVSPGPSGWCICPQARRLHSERWRLAAPLGRPVEPEV
jgi:hypothetical protein